MRKFIIAGNWKMHGSKASVRELLEKIKVGAKEMASSNVTWIVFPPAIFLGEAEKILSGTNIYYGAQNMHAAEKGAFTGEIAVNMLKDFGCRYVLVGHSERRTLFAESDALVAEKFVVAQKAGITPVLCIGETLEERKSGVTMQVLERQLDAVLAATSGITAFENAILAYEPVWAIGTGVTASPQEAEETHQNIRVYLRKFDARIAEKLNILYGGSLKPDNAAELLGEPDINGGLIGGASLKAEEFLSIGAKCNH